MAAAARHRSSTALRVLREQQALDLRIAGASYRQIADRLSVGLATAHADVERILCRIRDKMDLDCELWVILELETLGVMQTKAMAQVAQGNLEAMRVVLAIQNQRAKYLGLYAPTRQEVSGPGGGPIQHEFDFSHLSDAELQAEYDRVLAEAEGLTRGAAPTGEG